MKRIWFLEVKQLDEKEIKICGISFHTRQWVEAEGHCRNGYYKLKGTQADCWWDLEEQWRKGTSYMLMEDLQNLLCVVMWKTERDYNDLWIIKISTLNIENSTLLLVEMFTIWERKNALKKNKFWFWTKFRGHI